jgi:hypothetical protein
MKPEKMIRTILKWMFFILIFLFILVWLIGGGISQVTGRASTVGSFFDRFTHLSDSSSGAPGGVFGALLGINKDGESPYIFKLPWQPDLITGPDISGLANTDAGSTGTNTAWNDAATFGNASSHSGSVHISFQPGSIAGDAAHEYIELDAPDTNQGSVSLEGWSLQSTATGVRAYLPPAATLFRMGELNTMGPILLAPGAAAFVVTGTSPVGASLRENECSGYLAHYASFAPPFNANCPDPSADFPRTADAERRYGSTCFNALPQGACEAPAAGVSVSSACAQALANTFTYNGCVDHHQRDVGFLGSTWRVYLDQPRMLWNRDSDTIRLLDADGQVVDVYRY